MHEYLFTEQTVDGRRQYVPHRFAKSGWGETMRGMAVGGMLVREIERFARDSGWDGMFPARWTQDMMAPAAFAPSEVRCRLLKQGRRSCLVNGEIWQGERLVTRATALYLRPGDSVAEAIWHPHESFEAPPEALLPDHGDRQLYRTPTLDWGTDRSLFQNAEHLTLWTAAPRIVDGEDPTPIEAVATISDLGSLATNWGEHGINHINTDVTMYLTREPVGIEFGLVALDRTVNGGVAVGTSALWDRAGRFGTVQTAALSAPLSIDYSKWHDDL